MATAVKAPPAAPPDTPLGQLQMLCDPGSFHPLRSGVSSMRLGERAMPGDGVAAGAGEVDGRPVFCYAQDPAFLGGSLGEVHADTIVRTLRMAGDAGAPVVGFVRSGGARLQEGHAALAGYGRIFRASVELSRKVPQISILSGVSAGGGAYSPALTDYVVMTQDSRMFLTGPKVVAEAMGEEISMEELGGPKVHGKNGVAHLIAEDAADAVLQTRHLLNLLPQKIGGAPVFSSDKYDMYELVSILRASSRMLSSRFHAIVTSMPGGVPSAGITMDERIRNLMRERGHDHLLMKVDEPDLEAKALRALQSLDEEEDEIRNAMYETGATGASTHRVCRRATHQQCFKRNGSKGRCVRLGIRNRRMRKYVVSELQWLGVLLKHRHRCLQVVQP